MVKKRQANMERFAGAIANLVGDEQRKNRAGMKLGKPKFQLTRKKDRLAKKAAKKEKRITQSLLKAGAVLPEEGISKPAKMKNKKKKPAVIPSRESMVSLKAKTEKIYSKGDAVGGKFSKEEAEIANKKEDKVIKDMEKRLGFNRNKKKADKQDKTPKSLDVDGLGFVLHFKDDCDKDDKVKEAAESAADDLFNDLDSEMEDEDLDEDLNEDMDDELEAAGSDMEGNFDEELGEEMDGSNSEFMEDEVNDEDSANADMIDEDLEDDGNGNTPIAETETTEEETSVSDAPQTSYLPPHLRNQTKEQQLKRKIRGYVNKVSTANIKQIFSDVELVYQEFPRGDVNKALLAAVSESCLISSVMPARLCAEHMLLVACLSASIGPEFVSPLLEDLAQKLDKELSMPERHGKMLNNIVSMICFLYALKVVSCVLIFDIIKVLLKSFTEPDLEVLLYIFKSVGLDIRKDDPQALKQIVQTVNETGAKIKDKSSRFTWFVDTLTAVKNNNVSKIPNYDKSDINDIQKAYKATLKAAPNDLQVGLVDLLEAPTKGRWWIIGAAWVGNQSGNEDKKRDVVEFDSKLLALAKKNHMNTEVRRNVFCVIMSSQDFEHCFEQLTKLNIKDKQEREIIHVAVLCALKCKTYNPYYASVIRKFCQTSKNYQITTQFSVWDRLKELKSLNATKTSNFIKLLCSLFSSKTISLSVLKIVDFAQIDQDAVVFFKDLFRGLLGGSEVLITEIFGRLQPLPLDDLKNGMKVFMKHFLKPELEKTELKNMKIALKCF